MTNDEYFNEIRPKIECLTEIQKRGKDIAAGIIGQTLLKEDLFFCASADRNMNLSNGFMEMIRTRNLTCAGALLRLQMDNCMRTYAAFIAKDGALTPKTSSVNYIVPRERMKGAGGAASP